MLFRVIWRWVSEISLKFAKSRGTKYYQPHYSTPTVFYIKFILAFMVTFFLLLYVIANSFFHNIFSV
jgi:hypothetical protein